ncbi:MAG: tRNA epoxyqueuosine(34) reductase QueG [Alphaproteobacteria bacterium]|nr:tRNA epoxyqueuosine(34) reductase QueG [Alphaproteobacteria bacterium]
MPALAIREAIRREALAVGFDQVGFARARLPGTARRELSEFLALGLHGDMGWMAETALRRGDPKELWPEAASVVALGLNYGPSLDPLALAARPDRGRISVYARNRDYHDPLKKRLKRLARWMHESWGAPVKVFVDTAPVMEKPLAELSGLGWRGKHTNIVSREFGSWLFLGEILTPLDLPPDPPGPGLCGSCRRCLDACPTRAFLGERRIDARRCVSYLTIEHKGHIPAEIRPLLGNRVYGCDDCLAVCPWNRFARPTRDPDYQPRPALTEPRLADLAGLDAAAFAEIFRGSPVKRIGRERLLRNVLIAIGNGGEGDALPIARGLLGDPSPLIRAMAVWAVRRLADPAEVARLRREWAEHESDAEVRAEWY